MIPLSRPNITQDDIDAVVAVMKSGRLACGPKAQEFADKVAQRHGKKYAVPVSSGTAALHLILKSLGIGPGDEVITTSFSFVASTNCILYCGATPVFVDIDPETFCIDPALVEKAITPKTKAILSVDVFGNVADGEKLSRYGIPVVEDACEAIGAPGVGYGEAIAFAFYPNKQIVSGEGGVIISDNPVMVGHCRSLSNHGRIGRDVECTWMGYNYRMDEMSGVLGSSQMDRLNTVLAERRRLASNYLSAQPHLRPITRFDDRSSWFVFVVVLPPAINRNSVIDYLVSHGVESRAYFNPIHMEPYMRTENWRKSGELTNTEDIGSRCIALPFYIGLTESEIDTVVNTLSDALEDRSCQTYPKTGTATG
jgi:perosamine synthetase